MAPLPITLLQDLRLLDELDTLPSRQAVAVAATTALSERLHMLCAKGQIIATPEEIEQAVANYQRNQGRLGSALAPMVRTPSARPLRLWWARALSWFRAKVSTPTPLVVSNEPTGRVKPPIHKKWHYTHDLFGESWRQAWVESVNHVNLGGLHPKDQPVFLSIERDPLKDIIVKISIDLGIFSLLSYDSGVLCRFDDNKVFRLRMKDHDQYLTVLPSQVKGFLNQLEKSQQMHLEVPFHTGKQVHTMTFPVAGLNWDASPKLR